MRERRIKVSADGFDGVFHVDSAEQLRVHAGEFHAREQDFDRKVASVRPDAAVGVGFEPQATVIEKVIDGRVRITDSASVANGFGSVVRKRGEHFDEVVFFP